MTDVQHVPGQSEAFARRFATEVSGFASSDEYQLLDKEDRQRPGLVFAAVAKYLENADDDEVLTAAQIIEEAASTDDGELHNYLVTEIFEPWQSIDIDSRGRLLRFLGTRARRLHSQWTGVIVPSA